MEESPHEDTRPCCRRGATLCTRGRSLSCPTTVPSCDSTQGTDVPLWFFCGHKRHPSPRAPSCDHQADGRTPCNYKTDRERLITELPAAPGVSVHTDSSSGCHTGRDGQTDGRALAFLMPSTVHLLQRSSIPVSSSLFSLSRLMNSIDSHWLRRHNPNSSMLPTERRTSAPAEGERGCPGSAATAAAPCRRARGASAEDSLFQAGMSGCRCHQPPLPNERFSSAHHLPTRNDPFRRSHSGFGAGGRDPSPCSCGGLQWRAGSSQRGAACREHRQNAGTGQSEGFCRGTQEPVVSDWFPSLLSAGLTLTSTQFLLFSLQG